MAATHLYTAFPDPATRPRMCGNCVHNENDHMGASSHSWCGIAQELFDAGHECHLDRYEEREHSPEEKAWLIERTKGLAYMLKHLADNLTEEEIENPLIISETVKLYPILTKGEPLILQDAAYAAPAPVGKSARKPKKVSA